MKDVLVVMARAPVRGAVKTRLARRIGEQAAFELYCAFLRDIAERLEDASWRLLWAVYPPGADLAPALAGTTQCIGQRGGDLAERMRHCFEDLLRQARRVVMIGADAPHLSRGDIAAAFAALEGADVALKPARDGGYCLIGLRAAHDLFSGVDMGTPAVLAQTRARLDSLGLRAVLLAPSFDVDELEDLAVLESLLAGGTASLRHTGAALSRLGRL